MDKAKDNQIYQIELCFTCNKRLYLQCKDCRMIYCSPACQERNCENLMTRHNHQQNKHETKSQALRVMEERLPENIRKGIKGPSVQERLKRAIEKVDAKIVTSEASVDESIEEVDFADDKETSIKPLKINFSIPKPPSHKFESPAPVRESFKDSQGYFNVIVNFIDGSICSVTLEEAQLMIMSNQMIMNTDYEENLFPFVASEILKSYKSLIMAHINDNWTRCKVINNHDVILEDIDSGKKYEFETGNYQLKYPIGREMIINAFAYKIQLENVDGIKVGDRLKIRLIDENYDGVLKAELFESRFMLKSVKVKNLPLGKQSLMLLNGSEIAQGKIHVALNSPENDTFYQNLFHEVTDYIEQNQNKNNYNPVDGELVLTKIKDDINRAICLFSKDNVYKLFFLDFGYNFWTTAENIWKIPQKLVDIPVVSRTVELKWKSGNSAKLELCFEGLVEYNGKNKFSVLIEDC